MASLADSIVEFIRVRQLNIAVAFLFTIIYLAYQYRGVLFKNMDEEQDYGRSRRLSRSKSRSRSRSRHRTPSYRDYRADSKHRRGRKMKRCPDCNKMQL